MNYKISQDSTFLGNGRWSWEVWIDSPDGGAEKIIQVTWFLHHTFSQPVVVTNDREKKFVLKSFGWGMFQVRAELALDDGAKKKLSHWLKLDHPDGTAKVATKGIAATEEKKNKVFLSYGAEDQRVVAELGVKLKERGYEILDPKTIPGNVPLQAATHKMMRDSDLMLGIVGSDMTSPKIFRELNDSNYAKKPTLAVINEGLDDPSGLSEELNRVEVNLDSVRFGDEIADILGKIRM